MPELPNIGMPTTVGAPQAGGGMAGNITQPQLQQSTFKLADPDEGLLKRTMFSGIVSLITYLMAAPGLGKKNRPMAAAMLALQTATGAFDRHMRGVRTNAAIEQKMDTIRDMYTRGKEKFGMEVPSDENILQHLNDPKKFPLQQIPSQWEWDDYKRGIDEHNTRMTMLNKQIEAADDLGLKREAEQNKAAQIQAITAEHNKLMVAADQAFEEFTDYSGTDKEERFSLLLKAMNAEKRVPIQPGGPVTTEQRMAVAKSWEPIIQALFPSMDEKEIEKIESQVEVRPEMVTEEIEKVSGGGFLGFGTDVMDTTRTPVGVDYSATTEKVVDAQGVVSYRPLPPENISDSLKVDNILRRKIKRAGGKIDKDGRVTGINPGAIEALHGEAIGEFESRKKTFKKKDIRDQIYDMDITPSIGDTIVGDGLVQGPGTAQQKPIDTQINELRKWYQSGLQKEMGQAVDEPSHMRLYHFMKENEDFFRETLPQSYGIDSYDSILSRLKFLGQ